LKLGDFDSKLGLGLMVKKNENNFLTESVACWIDPEVMSDEKEKKVDWKRGDVFATGLCVFLALTGQHPFGTFLDEDRTAAAGAAANFRPGPGASQFVEGTEKVLENMRTLNFVNQLTETATQRKASAIALGMDMAALLSLPCTPQTPRTPISARPTTLRAAAQRIVGEVHKDQELWTRPNMMSLGDTNEKKT
jgi:hypothetical protein